MKRTFEYKILHNYLYSDTLAQLGADGWQLVQTSGIGTSGAHIFLREVTP